jgi:hypothetical protein
MSKPEPADLVEAREALRASNLNMAALLEREIKANLSKVLPTGDQKLRGFFRGHILNMLGRLAYAYQGHLLPIIYSITVMVDVVHKKQPTAQDLNAIEYANSLIRELIPIYENLNPNRTASFKSSIEENVLIILSGLLTGTIGSADEDRLMRDPNPPEYIAVTQSLLDTVQGMLEEFEKSVKEGSGG